MQSETKSTPIATPASDAGRDEIARIAAFMRAASIEVTRPTSNDLDAMGAVLRPETSIYLTAIPGRPTDELILAARETRARGLEPIPHIAARHFSSVADIERLVAALVRQAQIRQVMLIGGDGPARAGRVPDALSVLTSGVLQGAGLQAVGLPGFPDGHPVLSEDELELALVTKTAAAQSAGLEPHIVTQFCFDSRPILRWLVWLREREVAAPVRVGFAGPTNLMSWLKFARRCGVRASAEALASRSGLARHAFKSVAPDPLVRALASATAEGKLGEIEPHFFAFGGSGATARWAASAARGATVLDGAEGFAPSRDEAAERA